MQKYKYTGKQKDNSTNLYYYGARYYTSDLSRFTSIDPLLLDQASTKKLSEVLNDPQQLNSYSYARNNPVIYTDPTGEYAMAIPAIAKMAEAAMIAIMGSVLINDAVDNIKSTPALPQSKPNITTTPALPQSKGNITKTPAYNNVDNGIKSTPALPQGQGNIMSTPVYNGPTAGSCGVNMSCAEVGQSIQVGPITGYSRHGLNQAISRDQGRGVSIDAIKDAVTNPNSMTPQADGKTKYKGSDATVILNKAGEVITTYGKPRNK